MTRMIEIAGKVLAKVEVHDHRIASSKATILAWAECFELAGNVWMDEALEAVALHYSKPNPFPIMAGDVIAHCADQEPWSSEEHAVAWLRTWAGFPYSDMIERYTGVQWPAIVPPEGLDLKAEREWLAQSRLEWVQSNFQGLLTALVFREHKGKELEQ